MGDYYCVLNYFRVVRVIQVFACPLRNDSAEVLKELKGASHDLVYTLLLSMIMYACLFLFSFPNNFRAYTHIANNEVSVLCFCTND